MIAANRGRVDENGRVTRRGAQRQRDQKEQSQTRKKGNNKASRCQVPGRLAQERVQKQCVSLENVKDVTNDSLSRLECALAPPIVAIRLFAVTHCRAEKRKARPRHFFVYRWSLCRWCFATPLLHCFSPPLCAYENVIRHGSLGMF